jgi:hypothetical protein
MNRRRLFDWRLATSLALLMLVGYLVFAGIETTRDNRAKGERIDVLVTELQRQHADAEADRHSAAAERAQLLAGQRQLEAQYGVLIQRQAALLAYLRRHGIDVPARFIVTHASSATGSAPKPRRVTSRPSATFAPTPVTAGKSGKVPPGKAKRRH